MVRHAARTVPWPLLGLATVLLVAMLQAVETWPYTMWPLQGIAVGLVAGVTAFAYDEPAAAVVDTLPRGLPWRTFARSLGVVPFLGCWVAMVALTSDAYFGHTADVAGQGLAAAVVTTAAVSRLRLRGASSPAAGVATVVVGTTAYLALMRPLEDALPVFPYTGAGPWTEGRWLWSGLLVGGALWLVDTLRR